MKSILLSFAIISSLFSVGSSREVRIFKGTSRYNSDVICSVRDSKVYKNFSTYSSDIICTVRGEKIYKGSGSYSSDVLYTVRDDKVFKGNSNYNSDILMTIRDGKIFRGTSTYNSDIIANVRYSPAHPTIIPTSCSPMTATLPSSSLSPSGIAQCYYKPFCLICLFFYLRFTSLWRRCASPVAQVHIPCGATETSFWGRNNGVSPRFYYLLLSLIVLKKAS